MSDIKVQTQRDQVVGAMARELARAWDTPTAPTEVQVAARSILAGNTMSGVIHLTRLVASATPERQSWASQAGVLALRRFRQAWRQSRPARGDILKDLDSPEWPVDVTRPGKP